MDGMFANCKTLTALDVSFFDTRNVTDMSGMFANCKALTALDVSGFDTKYVYDMSGMFAGCEALTDLDVSGFDTQNVTDMNSMFLGCEKLNTIDVSHFNTAAVKYMEGMFSGCTALQTIDLHSFNTENVQDMGSMFNGCETLKTLDVSRFNTAKVYNMNNMFEDCKTLMAINIGGFDITSLQYAAFMFRGCNSLESIWCENDWNASATLVSSDAMFEDCDNLRGGNGTAYNPTVIDKTYARPDGGIGDEGYFSKAPLYTVTFLNKDGGKIADVAVEANTTAVAPEAPVVEGWTFTGWDEDITNVMADLTTTAIYQANTYEVVFFDSKDNTLLTLSGVVHGSTVTAPTELPAIEGYHHTGWTDIATDVFMTTTELEATEIKGDVTYKATYEINKYTVRFLDYDETVLSTQSVDWGKGASAPADPTREGWTFTGWSPADFTSVKADMDITAQYSKDAVVYTVTFVDWDDTKIIDIKVVEGNDATAPSDPTRDGYKFDGWDKTFTNVTSDLTVKATYTILTFTVKFVDYDETVLSEQKVDWSSDATAPADPSREGYDFIGWDKDFTNVTSDLTVTAQYKKKEATAIDETGVQTTDDSRKFIENGILYIERNGIRYTLRGQRLN